jgi:hypothetical protein
MWAATSGLGAMDSMRGVAARSMGARVFFIDGVAVVALCACSLAVLAALVTNCGWRGRLLLPLWLSLGAPAGGWGDQGGMVLWIGGMGAADLGQ